MKNTYTELKKAAKKTCESHQLYKVGIIGDCATQTLAVALKGTAYFDSINLNILDCDYNQIYMQLVDKESELYKFEPQTILIVMTGEKLYEKYLNTNLEQRELFAENTMKEIEVYHNLIEENSKANIIQTNFVEIDDRVFGNFSNKTKSSFLYQLRKLNVLLSENSQIKKNVFVVDIQSIQSNIGRTNFYDDKIFMIAKIPFSNSALPCIAEQIVSIINAIIGRIKKCVITDLDNTLWGGVIGDDGMENIEVGELGDGKAFTAYQNYLKELKNRGIILCVCSKNNEETAKEPFEKHPEMVLKLEDFAVFKANWEDKATNIKEIQKTLNIGMDSIVFIDDNPFERNVVKSLVSDITVPELPEDPALYTAFLREENYFETVSFSEEDLSRTQQYQAENKRTLLQSSFGNYDDYLQTLDMVGTVNQFDKFNIPRIAQLTQRSNQFNLRTVRYTEAEIERIASDDKYITAYFKLKDNFGDHGLISVVILEKKENDTLFIDTWLMSCRVLKRTVEEFIVNKIIEAAKNSGFTKVVGEYIKTPKNAMVQDIYETMGFENNGNNLFTAKVNEFNYNITYIVEEEEK